MADLYHIIENTLMVGVVILAIGLMIYLGHRQYRTMKARRAHRRHRAHRAMRRHHRQGEQRPPSPDSSGSVQESTKS